MWMLLRCGIARIGKRLDSARGVQLFALISPLEDFFLVVEITALNRSSR